MNTLTANEQALVNQLQPHLHELYRLYYALPMHAFEGTERLIAYGLLLLAEWSGGGLEVPARESRRILLVTYAVQAAMEPYQEARSKS